MGPTPLYFPDVLQQVFSYGCHLLLCQGHCTAHSVPLGSCLAAIPLQALAHCWVLAGVALPVTRLPLAGPCALLAMPADSAQ